jgi:F-type H+-transporting ATPase subunit delta
LIRGAIAGRYAQALYEIAAQEKKVDDLEQELLAVEQLLKQYPDWRKILLHPQITPAEKKELLKKLFEGRLSEITGNFLALLIDHRRESFLGDIVAEFTAAANAGRNIVTAQVTSAVELDNKEKSKIIAVLNRLAGKKAQVAFAVDPLLIGGAVVRMGDKVIDGSVRARLTSLRERLKAIS